MLALLKRPVLWALAAGGSAIGLAVVGVIRRARRKKADTKKDS